MIYLLGAVEAIGSAEASGVGVPGWMLAPFALMLLSIAVGPLVASHWWERNMNKLIVALVLGIPTAIWLATNGFVGALEHQLLFDYVPFIVLLGGLFAVTGGIHLSGDLKATPGVNSVFLGIGGVLASLMGTTGAAMLLIRPVIATNSQRQFKVHTILFFIAVVANAGGLLTPLGDPPLFLLYLKGAPFGWFSHMWYEWLLVNAGLILVYYLIDRYWYGRESKESLARDAAERKPLRIEGTLNFVWLTGIVCAVAFLNGQYFDALRVPEGGHNYLTFAREGAIVLMIALSLLTTDRRVREANHFTWHPIVEVACLFIGIFITMVPALQYLNAHAQDLGLETAQYFYFATGLLSGFLDNAPTALAFHAVAKGLPTAGAVLVAGVPEGILTAISLGAVLFGSMTYIGNGPNFMIKAIAEESGIKMPSFFAYMYKFSLIILLPIFVVMALLFL